MAVRGLLRCSMTRIWCRARGWCQGVAVPITSQVATIESRGNHTGAEAPAVRAVAVASVTIGPTDPAAQPATIGVKPAVLIVVANGDRPNRINCFEAISVCPWPHLAWHALHRARQRIDVRETALPDAGQTPSPRGQRPACPRHRRQPAGITEREPAEKLPHRGRSTNPREQPPHARERITSGSSILSAPTVIEATIATTFPAEFAMQNAPTSIAHVTL